MILRDIFYAIYGRIIIEMKHADRPLHDGLRDYARIAAFEDGRFQPIAAHELEELACTVISSFVSVYFTVLNFAQPLPHRCRC